MSSRRSYLSFFNDRRRGDFIFVNQRRRRRRWILAALLVAAGGGFATWWFTRPAGPPTTEAADSTTVATLLTAQSTTTTRDTTAGSSDLSCPEAGAHWTTFQAGPSRTGCVTAPTITRPAVLWATAIGVQGWLNNPVIDGDTVYVGSAGLTQFESDRKDGIYALDLATGALRWFFEASLDTNGVAVADGVVVATGDEGLVWGLDAEDGRALWSENLGSAVFGNPLIVDGLVVVGDGSGTVTAFSLLTGERQWRASVQGAVRGGAASDGELIFVAGEQREVLALDPAGNAVWRRTISGRGPNGDQVRVFAAPTLAGEVVVIPLVRDDVYAEPALLALDRGTGELRWRATDAAAIKTDWGNVRSSPAVVGEVLVYGEAYSRDLVAIGVSDGRTRWSAEVGPYCYPHWSSPAVVSGQVILPRYDGGLYAVDVATQSLAWSIYLGDQTLGGSFPPGYGEDFCQWQPASGFSVLASPAVSDDGVVVVGTLEGYLVAVGDRGW